MGPVQHVTQRWYLALDRLLKVIQDVGKFFIHLTNFAYLFQYTKYEDLK